MTRSDIPNLITIFRFFLIPPVLWLLWNDHVLYALFLFALAGISDGVDGYLARRFDWIARLGAILDPLADKGLIMLTLLVMLMKGMMPQAIVAVIILRDLIILSGATAFYFMTRKLEMKPSVVSKFNTAFQISLVVLVMWDAGVTPLPGLLVQGAMILVFITTVLSGFDYVVRWSAKARQHNHHSS